AMEHFEAVLRVQPDNAMARLELAKSLVANRQFARAKPLLAAVGEDSTDPAPHLLLYQVYQAEGNAIESARQRALYLELTSARSAGGMSGNLASRRLRRFVP
ncbi:MAG: tetratricopeptide repeat protein, partial [Bryobacteraceae bacterium]